MASRQTRDLNLDHPRLLGSITVLRTDKKLHRGETSLLGQYEAPNQTARLCLVQTRPSRSIFAWGSYRRPTHTATMYETQLRWMLLAPASKSTLEMD